MNQDQTQKELINQFRYIKNKTTKFVPQEDSFISTAGNPSLGIKYGNNIGINTINTNTILQAVLGPNNNLNNNLNNNYYNK